MSSLQDQLKSRNRSRTEVCYRLEPARAGSGLDAVEMTDGTYVIGSGAETDIRVDVPGVAPLHCRIICERERITLQAEDTRTWLNDGPIRKASVRSGDRLSIGPANFVIRISHRPIEESPEPEEEPVELATEVARAIRQQRLGVSARELVQSGNRKQSRSAAEQELEELRKSLAQTQQQLDAHKAALREQPEPVPSSLHTPMSELTGVQGSRRNAEAPVNPDWEARLRAKSEQIQRIKNRLQQRKTQDVRSIELQRQQIEAAQKTLALKLEELSQREQSLEAASHAQQLEQNTQLVDLQEQLEASRTELQDLIVQLDREQNQRQTLEEKLDETTRELDSNRQENDQLRSELYREVSARAELESVLSVERDRCTFAEQQRDEAEARCSRFSEQEAELRDTLEHLRTEYERQSHELESKDNLEAQLLELQTDRERLQRELEESVDHHQRELSELTTRVAESEDAVEAVVAERDAARQSVEELQSVLAESAEQLQELQSRLTNLESAGHDHARILQERDELLRERDELVAEREQRQNDFAQLEEERESLRQQLEVVTEQMNAEASTPAEDARFEAEVQSLHEALRELKDAYETLSTENGELQSALAESQSSVKDLVTERESLQSQLAESTRDAEPDENATAFEQGLLEEVESLRELVASLETSSATGPDVEENPAFDRAELDSEWERISDERDRLLELRQAVEEERDAFRQVRLDLQQMQQEVAQQQSDYEQKLEELEQLRNELQNHAIEQDELNETVDNSTEVDAVEDIDEESPVEAEAGSLDSLIWGVADTEEALETSSDDDQQDVLESARADEDGSELGLDLPGLSAALSSRHDEHTTEETGDHRAEQMETHGESNDIRRRLAEMFGFSDDEEEVTSDSEELESSENESSELAEEQTAEYADDTEAVAETDEEPAENEPTDDAPVETANGEVIVDDIEDADSVAAYMERLFARTSGRQDHEPMPASSVRTPSVPEKPVLQKPATVSTLLEQEDAEECVEPLEPVRKNGPVVKVDRETVMKEIASLRDVANQNARESLIAHKWKQLRVGVMMNVTLTSISFVGAIVLSTAPLWYGQQFWMYAAAMAALGLCSGYSLLNNYVTLIRMKQPASSGQQKMRKALEKDVPEIHDEEERTEE